MLQVQQAQFTTEQLSISKTEVEKLLQDAQKELQQLSTVIEERTLLAHHLQQVRS